PKGRVKSSSRGEARNHSLTVVALIRAARVSKRLSNRTESRGRAVLCCAGFDGEVYCLPVQKRSGNNVPEPLLSFDPGGRVSGLVRPVASAGPDVHGFAAGHHHRF